MDSVTRSSASAGFDRLAALREPVGGHRERESKKFRFEVLIGIICIVAGMALVLGFVILQSPDDSAQVNGVTLETTIPPNESTLLAGEAFVALAVDQGKFPPDVSIGDFIKVVVTPGVDGSGETKMIPQDLLVTHVAASNEMTAQTIFTVRAPQSLLPTIAESGPLHIARVQVGAS